MTKQLTMYSRCQTFTKNKFPKNDPRFFWIGLSIFALIIGGCQQVTQKVANTTYTEIYIRYLADKKELKGEATFYTKGDSSTAILTFDNVTFANHPMKGKNLNANHTRYRIDLIKHTLEPSYELRFWNKNQKPKSIPIELSKVDSFSFSKIIKKGKGTSLVITGNEVNPNEKISFIFTNKKNETAELKLGKVSIDKPIQLNKEQLSMLPLGKNEVYLIRTQIFNKTKDLKAKGVLQFYSKSIEIEVVE